MSKLCFSCFKKIPLFAGKCPYCLDQYQGVYGRLILGVLIIACLIGAAYLYTPKEQEPQQPQSVGEILKELKK